MDFNQKALDLQAHYSDFKVSERLLFTGHSHQAWPDVAKEGLLKCFDDAATYVDEKWEHVFKQVDVLRDYLKDWYQDSSGQYTPASNTHDLLIKWLSALDLKSGDHVVSTMGEFYSVFRQNRSLIEMGVNIEQVDVQEFESISERIIEAINPGITKAVIVSRVFFETGLQIQGLVEIASYCVDHEIPLLIDDYHGTNVLDFKIGGTVFENTYWFIGGYKYLQWGEGNCFLRYPKDCKLKPVLTGWFSSFSTLRLPKSDYTIQFDPEMKYAGGTFDPASAYRAARVVQFFKDQNLDKQFLTEHYRFKFKLMKETFESLNLPTEKIQVAHNKPDNWAAGFLPIKTAQALDLQKEMLKYQIFTDARGTTLRFGAAPYTTKNQIEKAFGILKDLI